MASTPVAAVTSRGTVIVRSGSTTARSASMWRLCTASLFWVAGSVTSARVPPSLPVPAVVGTCTRRAVRPCTFSGPTTSWMLCPLPGSTAASLARSMALPPPKPITRSGLQSAATASSASRFGMSGSGRTVPNTVGVPGRSSRSTRPALKASATTRIRWQPWARAIGAGLLGGAAAEADRGRAFDEDGGRERVHAACSCWVAGAASSSAYSTASMRLRGLAMPWPAMSKAVP